MNRILRKTAKQLAAYFRRNGYVRRQNVERLTAEGAQQYKKGEEIRLIAYSRKELKEIRDLLVQAGFKPGRPFKKGSRLGQPVYGREAVERFLEIVESVEDV